MRCRLGILRGRQEKIERGTRGVHGPAIESLSACNFTTCAHPHQNPLPGVARPKCRFPSPPFFWLVSQVQQIQRQPLEGAKPAIEGDQGNLTGDREPGQVRIGPDFVARWTLARQLPPMLFNLRRLLKKDHPFVTAHSLVAFPSAAPGPHKGAHHGSVGQLAQ